MINACGGAMIEIMDAVHGTIKLTDMEKQVIDTPAFQRLRHIKQLGLGYLVFPSALHTRFEHCIGACHLAGRLVDALVENIDVQLADLVARGIDSQGAEASGLRKTKKAIEDERAFVRMAALLHDIGHGPFSHTLDHIRFSISPTQAFDHEAMGADILSSDQALSNILNSNQAAKFNISSGRIAELLTHSGAFKSRTWLRDIVSSPADVDKFDYLRRDSHFTGVGYGNIDLDRLLSCAYHHEDPVLKESYVAFSEGAVMALENMIVGRYHIRQLVAFHKTRVASDIMVKEMFSRLNSNSSLISDLGLANSKPPSHAYILQSDCSVIGEVATGKHGSASKAIADSLRSRTLFKSMLVWTDQDLEQAGLKKQYARKLVSKHWAANEVDELRRRIANIVGCAEPDVYVHFDSEANPLTRKVVDYSSNNMTDDDIIILRKDRQSGNYDAVTLPDVSQLICDHLEETRWRMIIVVDASKNTPKSVSNGDIISCVERFLKAVI